MKKVAIIMGSSSDLGVVRKAAEVLDSFSVPYEVHVYSAHRTPEHRAPGTTALVPLLPPQERRPIWLAPLQPIPRCRSSASL